MGPTNFSKYYSWNAQYGVLHVSHYFPDAPELGYMPSNGSQQENDMMKKICDQLLTEIQPIEYNFMGQEFRSSPSISHLLISFMGSEVKADFCVIHDFGEERQRTESRVVTFNDEAFDDIFNDWLVNTNTSTHMGFGFVPPVELRRV